MERFDGNIRGNIHTLLAEGCSQKEIAKRFNISRKSVWKYSRLYVINGDIEKIARGTYRKAIQHAMLPPHKPLANVTTPPIIIPVKFGGIFAQIGKPPLPYDEFGKAYYEEKEFYKAQFGKHKTQIWLYSGFQGATVDERIDTGHQLLLQIASNLSQKFGITLTHLRWYENIEWVDASKDRSKETAKGAELKKGTCREVAGAIHKFSDFSHPDQFQINPIQKGDITRATDHARIHERVYSGDYERRFEMLMQLHEKVMENLIAIRQRMDLEAKQ